MKELSGKLALITGASRGLGVDIARAMAKEGAELALAARSIDALEELKASLEQEYPGRRIGVYAADLSQREVMLGLIAEVEEAQGPVDILINNAGIEGYSRYEEVPIEEIERMIDVNLRAPMLLSRQVLPGMIQRGSGHIVNIASLAGLAGSAFGESYSASKHGLVGFNRALRSSIRAASVKGVGASVICPGYIADAGMFAKHQRELGVDAPALLGTSKPSAVSKAVIKAIRKDLPELVVNPGAPQVLIAIGLIFPRFGEWLSGKVGAYHVGQSVLKGK